MKGQKRLRRKLKEIFYTQINDGNKYPVNRFNCRKAFNIAGTKVEHNES